MGHQARIETYLNNDVINIPVSVLEEPTGVVSVGPSDGGCGRCANESEASTENGGEFFLYVHK
jgi:hypothetical protein